MESHSSMLKSFELIGAPKNVIEPSKSSMNDWETNMFLEGHHLGQSPLTGLSFRETHYHHCCL